MKGYVQIYTGNGKGKTTAALGLALRAYGAGLHIYIAQFLKGTKTSELKVLRTFKDLITVKQYGKNNFIYGNPDEEDKKLAKKAIEEINNIIKSCNYDIVILDEANYAVHLGLIAVDDLLKIIDKKPQNVELVITGRYAKKELIKKADLVTEMRQVKHYFNKGIKARMGIEK